MLRRSIIFVIINVCRTYIKLCCRHRPDKNGLFGRYCLPATNTYLLLVQQRTGTINKAVLARNLLEALPLLQALAIHFNEAQLELKVDHVVRVHAARAQLVALAWRGRSLTATATTTRDG